MERPQYRVSVTTVEQYRRYMNGEIPEKDLVATIQKKFKGNEYTRIGSAFHKMIEQFWDNTIVVYDRKRWRVSEGYMFPEAVADKAMAFRYGHIKGVYEVPAEKVYEVGAALVTVSAKLDCMEGVTGYDHKLVFSEKDTMEFMNSSQANFYIDICELKEFQYHVYEVSGYKNAKEVCAHGVVLRGFEITTSDAVRMFPYPAMQQELWALLGSFMNYIEQKNFYQYIQPKHETGAN